MNHLRRISLDKAAVGFTAVCASVVLGDAYATISLSDAQTAEECRYSPTSQIITADHVQQLDRKGLVVIKNVLSPSELEGARREVQQNLSQTMDAANHLNDKDVRQDQVCLVRQNADESKQDHGEEIIHCIKLLRGIPDMLNRFDYSASSSFVVPRQCQLARYQPNGAIYVRHLDKCNYGVSEMGLVGWLRASDYRYRAVTAILYLNSPQWESEGQLRCFVDSDDEDDEHNDSWIDIDPIGGTLVLFDSARIEHQVQPSTDDRYALTLWINGITSKS